MSSSRNLLSSHQVSSSAHAHHRSLHGHDRPSPRRSPVKCSSPLTLLAQHTLLLLLLLLLATVNGSSSSSHPHHHHSRRSPVHPSSSSWSTSRSSHTPHSQSAHALHPHASSSSALTSAPEFSETMENRTVPLGRDVTFECAVNNLGSYKLAWLKVDNMKSLSPELPSALALTEPEIISIQTQIVLTNSSSSTHAHHNAFTGGGHQRTSKTHHPHPPHHQQQPHQSQQTSQSLLESTGNSQTPKESRYRVSHSNHRQWFLHIKSVKASDRGYYMCQINSEPIISQAAFLDILIAPSIDYNSTSEDVSVDERHRLSLRCRAQGYPPPTILWRREDGKDINLGQYGGKKYSANKVEGEFLNITQVTRDDMGAYLCIASNSVPPSVSKRIIVRVNFRPKIKVSNQLVGAMMTSDVQLECRIEGSPQPTTNWVRSDGTLLHASAKYSMREEHDSYRTKMKLRISALDEKDFGSYKCVAKNEIGEKEGLVRLYEIPPANTPSPGDPSFPTYTIYTYQGRQKGLAVGGNGTEGGPKNWQDYTDYQQASASSSSLSSFTSGRTHQQSFLLLLASILALCYTIRCLQLC